MLSKIVITLTALATVVAIGSSSDAGEMSDMELAGYAALDVRVFAKSPLYPDQHEGRLNPSIVLRPELSWQWNGGDDRIDVVPFARLDAQDVQRRHADLREFKYSHFGEDWDLKAGFDKVFWGVTESRHLVDIVNQTDAVEDIDGEDKLGQPMVNLGLQRDWGDVNLIVMPYFRERTFAGPNGRPTASPVVDTDFAIYESSLGRRHPDLAVRYSTFFGDWDLGVSHFHGTSREPRLVSGENVAGDSVWIPYYDIIDQTGIDVQATIEEWLWKMEGIVRAGHGDTFGAASMGLEYSFFGLIDDTGDLGLLAEYHYDGRGNGAPGTAYDNDLFFGVRATLNDADDTDFLAGVLIDRISQAQTYSAETSTRLNDNWTAEAELRIVNDLTSKDPGFGARRDSHLQVRLTRYF